MRQTKKDGPHMNSGGIALRPVQDVGQFAISIPAQRNTPIAQARKEKGSCAQRQVLAIVTGDETTRQTLRKEREGWGTRRVYPFFDKIHGNYVYLTKSQYYGASSLAWLGMSCFLGYIIVHQRLKHLVGRSPKDNNADTSRD
jgi:hypothetical protein